MPSTNNLASYFSAAAANNHHQGNDNSGHAATSPDSRSQGSGYSSTLSIFGIDPSQSNAVHAEDNESFEKSSYQLKRTRSMGLLDHFIAPTKKLIEEDFSHTNHFKNDPLGISRNISSLSHKSLSLKNLDQLNRDLSTSSASNIDNNHINDGNNSQDSNTYSPCLSNSPCSFTFHSSDLKSPGLSDNKTDPNSSCAVNNASSFLMSSAESPPSVYSIDNSMSTYNPSTSPAVTTGEILQPHDDTDIIFEPKNRVDYFSYDWTDRELLRSWRYVVDQKKCTDNAERLENTRLENASWRTWARAKYCLKTVTPESINWKKDKDVSWLYGPKCNPETESDALNNLRENKIKISNHNEMNNITPFSSHNDTYVHEHENTIPHAFNDAIMSYSSLNTSNSSIPLSHHSNFPASQSSQQLEDPISSTVIPSTTSTDSIIIPQYVKPILKQRKISEKINAHSELFKLNISQERKIKQQQQQSVTSPTIVTNSNGNSPVVNVNGNTDNELHRVASPLVLMSSPLELSSSAMDIDQFPDDKQHYFVQNIDSDSDDSYEDDDEESRKKKENKKLLKSSFLVVPTNQDESNAKRSRRIHFNDRVEQCRIVDYYSDSEEEEEFFNKNHPAVNGNVALVDSNFDTGFEKDIDADNEDEDHDSGLVFSTTGSLLQQLLSMRQISRTSSTHSSVSHYQAQRFASYPKIIEPIPAIKIRFRGDESSEEESDFESEDEDNYQWLFKNNNVMCNNDMQGNVSSTSGNDGARGVIVENGSLSDGSVNNNNNNSSGRRNDFYNYNSVYMPENLPLNENYRNDMNAYYNNIAQSYMNSAAHTANTIANAKSLVDNNSYSVVHDDDDDDDDIEMEDVPQSIALDLQNQVLDDSMNDKNESGNLLSHELPTLYNSLTNGPTNSFNSSMNQLAIGSNDNEVPTINRPHLLFLSKKPSSAKNLSSVHFNSSSLISFAHHSPFILQERLRLNKSGTTILSNTKSNDKNINQDGVATTSISRQNSVLLRNNSKPCFSLLEEDDSSDEEIKDVPHDIMMPSKEDQHEQHDLCPVKFIANKSGFFLADDDDKYDESDTESDDDDGNVFNFSHTNHRENISLANLASLNNLN